MDGVQCPGAVTSGLNLVRALGDEASVRRDIEGLVTGKSAGKLMVGVWGRGRLPLALPRVALVFGTEPGLKPF